MYLTDNPGDPTRWRIPNGQTVQPGGTLLIWADDDPGQGPLHATFKLSSAGEEVLLFDTDGKTLVDRLTFGPQVADISTGRLHDGQPYLVTFPEPTPLSQNGTLVCGSRRYSSLDPTTQELGLLISGTPGLGKLVYFLSVGGPASGQRVLIAAPFPSETPLGITNARLLVSSPFLIVDVKSAGVLGSTVFDLRIPNQPSLVGQAFYLQTFGVNAGPWLGSTGLEVKVCR